MAVPAPDTASAVHNNREENGNSSTWYRDGDGRAVPSF